MGAGAINPFYNPIQSSPMSHFVDESLPIDLMLKAGMAKQGQYDKTQAGLDLLASYDQEALKGRDTEYVDSVKDDVAKFVDSTLGKDLSENSIARDAFKFATKIQQDKKLEIARNNLAAVQKLKQDASELRTKKELFMPSYVGAMQQINNYTDNKGEVTSIGDLFVEKSLDRRKAREAFFDNASASFNEEYKKIQGLIMKIGVGGISAGHIQNLAKLGFNDYLTSNAGQQDVDYYDYLVKTGQTPTDRFGKPITDGSRYVLDQMVRTGLERVSNKSTISFNKGLNELAGKNNKPKEDGVKTKTQSATVKDFDYDETVKIANSGRGAVSQQARSLLDQVRNKLDKDVTVIAHRDKIKALTTGQAVLNKDGSVREKPSQGGMTLVRENAFDGAFDENNLNGLKLSGKDNVKKLENYVKNNIYKLIEKEAKDGNTEFFDNLTFDSSENYGFPTTAGAVYANVAKVTEKGIEFIGSTEVFRWDEMGIDTKSSKGKQFIKDASGPHYGGIIKSEQPNKIATKIGSVLNSYVDEKGAAIDKTMAYSSSGLDYIKNIVEDIAEKRDELADGTVVTPQMVYMPTDPKVAKNISELVGRDNFKSNHTVSMLDNDESGLPQIIAADGVDYQDFEREVVNNSNFTTRIGTEGGKFLEITTNSGTTGATVKKYIIEENQGTESEVMKYVYDSNLGEGNYDQASAIEGLQNLTNESKSVLSINGFNRLFDIDEKLAIENKNIGLKLNDKAIKSSAVPSIFTYGLDQTPVTIGKIISDVTKEKAMTESNAAVFAGLFAHNLSYNAPTADLTKYTKDGAVYNVLNTLFKGETMTNSQKELLSLIKTESILGYNQIDETKQLTLLLAGILKVD